jgi:hypothetical protein
MLTPLLLVDEPEQRVQLRELATKTAFLIAQ